MFILASQSWSTYSNGFVWAIWKPGNVWHFHLRSGWNDCFILKIDTFSVVRAEMTCQLIDYTKITKGGKKHVGDGHVLLQDEHLCGNLVLSTH